MEIDKMNNQMREGLLVELLKDYIERDPALGLMLLTNATIKMAGEFNAGLYQAVQRDEADGVLSGVFITLGKEDTETFKALADKIDEEQSA